MLVRCMICSEFIGITDLDRLRLPLSGGMFDSIDPAHGFPPPFDASLDWETMRCPYGRIHRPFVKDDQILTDEGIVIVTRDGAELAPDLSTEVGRDSIQDRTITVSDDEAERIARETLRVDYPTVPVDYPSVPVGEGPVTSPFTSDGAFGCPICKKGFTSPANLGRHMSMAHKEGKKPNG